MIVFSHEKIIRINPSSLCPSAISLCGPAHKEYEYTSDGFLGKVLLLISIFLPVIPPK